MQVNKQYLFPTVFYEVKDVLPKDTFDSVRQHIVESYKIIKMGKFIFDDLKFVYDDFEITEMWANVTRKGENHKVHTHQNNIYSGVIYLESGSSIRFLDPRPAANVLSPEMKEYNSENSNICGFPSTENTMLLFPSWLQHYVPKNVGSERRTSISFNLMLRGMVGRKGSLQSAKF